MNVNEAIKDIYEYLVDIRLARAATQGYGKAWVALQELMGTDLSPSPQWLRHEGGAMPEGVTADTLVLAKYDQDGQMSRASAWMTEWEKPLWYMVIPPPPAPPKAKTERWRSEEGGEYHYIDGEGLIRSDVEYCDKKADNRYNVGNYFRTWRDASVARPAILAAFKQVQGGGE